jgi:predicted enzyme related to lactoylglutathione lyase
MISKVKFVSIPVRDQDRAVEFYTKTLGFTLTTDQPFDGTQRWIELEIPGAETSIVLYTPKGQEDRIGTFANLAYVTEDIDTTYEELRAKGVEFTTRPERASWGKWWAAFKDSEGNEFGLGVERED